MEAFSDGVMAVIITIMVLEIKAPHGFRIQDLKPVLPALMNYVLSFIYMGIYWNNHHHLMHTVKNIKGNILWANLHLLFWLSLIPFVTAWMDENHFESLPVALYGVVLLMCAIAYFILQTLIIKEQGENSLLKKAIGTDLKGKISPVCYTLGIIFSFFAPWASILMYVLVAVMWLIPDKRIEKMVD